MFLASRWTRELDHVLDGFSTSQVFLVFALSRFAPAHYVRALVFARSALGNYQFLRAESERARDGAHILVISQFEFCRGCVETCFCVTTKKLIIQVTEEPTDKNQRCA